MKLSRHILLFLLLSAGAAAQEQFPHELMPTFTQLDSLIFEMSFNRCDHSAMKDLIHEDFEFYHDTGGLETSKAAFIKTIEQNICGNPDMKPIRKLVAGSMQLFPMRNNGELYAVIQSGEHEFYIREPGKALYLTSTAKFTHLWVLENDNWLLKRVLSYNHVTPED